MSLTRTTALPVILSIVPIAVLVAMVVVAAALDSSGVDPETVGMVGGLVFDLVFFPMWIYSIVKAIKNPALAVGRKALWVVLLVFLGLLTMPIYWIAQARGTPVPGPPDRIGPSSVHPLVRAAVRPWLGAIIVMLACAVSPAASEDHSTSSATPSQSTFESTPEVAPPEAEPPPQAEAEPTFEQPEDWPTDLPFVRRFDPKHATYEQSPAGDIRLHASVESRDLELVWNAWKDAFAAAGFSPREPCTEGESYACEMTDGHRLATLSVRHNQYNETYSSVRVDLLPPDHQPISKLPGACVPLENRKLRIEVNSSGIDQEGEHRRGQIHWDMSAGPGADLDGDGKPEWYVPKLGDRWQCPEEVENEVYITRGDCGHFVGTIIGPITQGTTMAEFRKGLRIVTTEATWADQDTGRVPTHHTRTRRYVFDGRRLQQKKDEKTSGRCHHCGVASCRRLD